MLHPNIRDRLARVREALRLTGVANFLGVCRDPENNYEGHAAWLMWEYVEGQTFDQFAADTARSADVALAARELILTVDSLHLQGIVHGSIKGRNVLIDPTGAIRLTHVSPLLYTDPSEDAQSAVEMLWSAVQARPRRRRSGPR